MPQKHVTPNDTRPVALLDVFPNVEALAAALGRGRGATYRALRAGRIPAIKISARRYLLPRAPILEWLRTAGQQQVGR